MNLLYYIGVDGILALTLPVAGLLLLLIYCRSRKRSVVAFRVVIMVLVALWFSARMWDDVSIIRPDRSEEMELGRERQREARMREVRTAQDRARQIRFAEESPDDDVWEAGEKSLSQLSKYERAAREAQQAQHDGARAYRSRGVQRREGGRPTGRDDEFRGIGDELEREEREVMGRVMKEADMYMALRWGRFVVGFGKAAIWISFLFMLLDYLLRFNQTANFFFPLPLGLLLIDRCMPKKMLCWFGEASEKRLADMLAGMVRRGESFIYFGGEKTINGISEALTGGDNCSSTGNDWSTQSIKRLVAGPIRLMPLEVASLDSQFAHSDPEYVFETAWFTKQSYFCPGKLQGEGLLKELLPFSELRLHTQAFAARTVNVVWHHDSLPDQEVISEWVRIAPQINIKLIVISPREALPDSLFSKCDEQYETCPEREPIPWVFDILAKGKGGKALYSGIRGSGRLLRSGLRNLGPALKQTGSKLAEQRQKAAESRLERKRKASAKKDEGTLEKKKGTAAASDKASKSSLVKQSLKETDKPVAPLSKVESKQEKKQASVMPTVNSGQAGEKEAKNSVTVQQPGSVRSDDADKPAVANSSKPDPVDAAKTAPVKIRTKEDLAARIRARREADEKRRHDKAEQKRKVREQLGLAGKSASKPPASSADDAPETKKQTEQLVATVSKVEGKPEVKPEKALERDTQPVVKTSQAKTEFAPKKKIVFKKKPVSGGVRKQPTKAGDETDRKPLDSVEELPRVAPPVKQCEEERSPAAPPVGDSSAAHEKPEAEVSSDFVSAEETVSREKSSEEAAASTVKQAVENEAVTDETEAVAEPSNIEFNCPLCDLRMAISSEYVGQPVVCPGCTGVINVPDKAEPDTPEQPKLTFNCPHCGQLMEGQDEWVGQQVACPACNGLLVVPAREANNGGNFKFFCQHCGQKLSAQNEWIGQAIECPKCSNSITINPPGTLI